MSRVSNFSFGITIVFAIVLGSTLGIGVGYIVKSFLKPAAIEEKQPQDKIEQVRDIPNNEFYTEWDIVYVESIDDGWVVSTEQYGDLFIQMTYTQAITFASVLTYIGYSCDYSCKEEMLGKAILEFNQRMYHE